MSDDRELSKQVAEVSLMLGDQKKKKARQRANRQILEHLRVALMCDSDIRFGQALVNLGIIKGDKRSTFYEEPEDTLARIKKILES